MTKLFGTGLFGYSKKSVCDYIDRMNEEFSQKLLVKDQAHKDAIRDLETQVEQLRKENERLCSGRQEVATAIIDAKTFAADLKARAEADDRAMREDNHTRRMTERQQIRDLAADISELQRSFRSILHSMDEKLEHYALQCQSLERTLEWDTAEGANGHREENL